MNYLDVLHDQANRINAKYQRVQDDLINLSGTNVGIEALKPHLYRAVQAIQPRVTQMLLAKYRASGLHKDSGDLESAIHEARLSLSFHKSTPKLSISLPAKMGEGFYARVWALDRGRRTKRGKTHAFSCFTLSQSEKRQIGNEITNLALSYIGAANHGG